MIVAVPINWQTWAVCGGRSFSHDDVFNSAMSALLGLKGCPRRIVHGGAKGADAMAAKWADSHAVDVIVAKADWSKHGRSAGPIRNQEIISQHKPDLLIAFPGGRGTADMMRRAREAGIEVAEIKVAEIKVPARDVALGTDG